MREIKYKYFRDGKWHIWEVNSGFNDNCYYHALHSSSGMLQYTGLKDKNGVEIYEHDLFRCDGEIYRVEWVEAFMTYCPFTSQQWAWFKSGSNHFKYCLDSERSNGKRHFLFEYESWEIEVIGNIYENPELL